MSVSEIVAASGVGQSTVSHHLKILADVRFVLVERRGTTNLYRIDEQCVSCFPTAADIIMGNPAASGDSDASSYAGHDAVPGEGTRGMGGGHAQGC